MKTRRLGTSDLQLTPIGLGTWAMGGDGWPFAWGPQDDQASMAAIHQALDQGVNWIDTAPVYGLGHAEEVVGRALAERPDEVILATKCGRVWEPGQTAIGKSLRADSLRREAETSLRRLNVEAIDLFQIHWPEPDEEIEEGWATVAALIREGKVRYGGVSNFNLAQLKRAQAIHPVTSLQPPYSMFERTVEEALLDYCAANHIGVVAYSPMQAGLLTGKFTGERAAQLPESDWRSRSPSFQEPQLGINLDSVNQLRALAEREGKTVAQMALAWVLRRQEMTSAIVGARSPQQIAETVQAGDWDLPPSLVDEIEIVLAERRRKLADLASPC